MEEDDSNDVCSECLCYELITAREINSGICDVCFDLMY